MSAQAEVPAPRDLTVTIERQPEAHLAAWEDLVANAEDLCARDPQLAARGHFVDRATPEGRTVRIAGPPFLLSETPASVRGPGPLLGEHSDEVLAGILGCDAEELRTLHADDVI